MAYYGGLEGILTGLTKSTDHPSVVFQIALRLGRAVGIGMFMGTTCNPDYSLPNWPYAGAKCKQNCLAP